MIVGGGGATSGGDYGGWVRLGDQRRKKGVGNRFRGFSVLRPNCPLLF